MATLTRFQVIRAPHPKEEKRVVITIKIGWVMIVNDEIKGNIHPSLSSTAATYPDRTLRKTFGWVPWGAGAT